MTSPRFALDFRLTVRPPFKPWHLAQFVFDYPEITRISRNSESIIIKGREQVRKEMAILPKRMETAGNLCEQNGEKLSETDVKNGDAHPERAKKLQLYTQILTEQGHRCFYCDQSLDVSGGELDSILPTNYKHTGLNPASQLIYYRALKMLGLVVVACRRCNAFKGLGEQAGSQVIYHWRRGYYILSPCSIEMFGLSLQPRISYNVPPFTGVSGKKAPNTPLNAELMWAVAEGLAGLGLRITRLCSCVNTPLFVQYNYEARTIIIACGQHCLAKWPRIGFFDRNPAHSPENNESESQDDNNTKPSADLRTLAAASGGAGRTGTDSGDAGAS